MHCNTQHQVRAGRGAGDGATRLTARKHWDWGLAGDKTHRRHPHVTEYRLQGMGDGGGEPTPGGVSIVWRGEEEWGVEGALGQTW